MPGLAMIECALNISVVWAVQVLVVSKFQRGVATILKEIDSKNCSQPRISLLI